MLAGFTALWRGIRHLNRRGYYYIWSNLLWIILSLPIVTAPAAWAGLVKMSYDSYHSPSANMSAVWSGFKEHWRHGLMLFVLNFLIVGINLNNLLDYGTRPELIFIPLRAIWLLVLFYWFTIQLYMWVLYYEMETPTLLGAMRLALVMVMRNPLFTIGLWLGLLPIILLSTAFPAAWLLLTGGVLASIANSAVINRLQTAGLKQPLPNNDA